MKFVQANWREAFGYQGTNVSRQVVKCEGSTLLFESDEEFGEVPTWSVSALFWKVNSSKVRARVEKRCLASALQGVGAPLQRRVTQPRCERPLRFGRTAGPAVRRTCLTSAICRLVLLLILFTACVRTHAAEADLLDRWFAAQAELKTWSANVTQTRTLKALKDPLKTEGRVWFAAPNRFRWELGEPAQTIAVREPGALVVVYPKLKRAERYALDGPGANQWRDALTILEAGFPRSRVELEKQFEVVATLARDAEMELVLQPRASRARKLIAEVRLVFGKEKLELRATELRFADGSQLRNEFADARLNPPIDDTMFTASVPADFKVTEPLKRGGK